MGAILVGTTAENQSTYVTLVISWSVVDKALRKKNTTYVASMVNFNIDTFV